MFTEAYGSVHLDISLARQMLVMGLTTTLAPRTWARQLERLDSQL